MKQILAAAALALAGASAAAAPTVFFANLGPEVPGATGSGTAKIIWESTDNTLSFDVSWSGLSGTTTVAHIHCCVPVADTGTVGVAVTPGTLPGFPVGVTSGSYGGVVDLDFITSFGGAFYSGAGGGTLLGARDALLAGMSSGKAYFNIHSTLFPGGELRGFLRVPEPGSLALAGLALGLVAFGGRRRAGAGR